VRPTADFWAETGSGPVFEIGNWSVAGTGRKPVPEIGGSPRYFRTVTERIVTCADLAPASGINVRPVRKVSGPLIGWDDRGGFVPPGKTTQ
jgi:hypothetical protein